MSAESGNFKMLMREKTNSFWILGIVYSGCLLSAAQCAPDAHLSVVQGFFDRAITEDFKTNQPRAKTLCSI